MGRSASAWPYEALITLVGLYTPHWSFPGIGLMIVTKGCDGGWYLCSHRVGCRGRLDQCWGRRLSLRTHYMYSMTGRVSAMHRMLNGENVHRQERQGMC